MTTVEVNTPDGTISAAIEIPPGKGPWPGVVVVHDALGLRDEHRAIVRRIAGHGYLAAAPDLFNRGGALRCIRSVFGDLYAREGRAFDDILAVRDIPVPAGFAPPGGVADLTVAIPAPAHGEQPAGEQIVTCRAAFPTPAQRASIAVPGAAAQFLIDPEFLLEATEDRLHQSYRAAAMPHTSELVGILREAGFPAVVSGAGPSVLVLCPGPSERLAALEVAKRHTATSWEPHLLAIDVLGATVEEISEKTASPSA